MPCFIKFAILSFLSLIAESLCIDETTPLTANGNNLLWYVSATDGTGSTDPPVPNTSGEGTEDFWVSQTINNCESPRAKITVTVISCECNGEVNEREVTGTLGQILAGEYIANVRIFSSDKVVNNATVIFRAGKVINLYPGFEVPKSSTLHAFIAPCEDNNINNEALNSKQSIGNQQNSLNAAPIAFKVSPNPFKGQAKIEFFLPQAEEVSIGLFDQSGKKLEEVISSERLNPGPYEVALNSNQLYGGMFYVILQTPTERIVKKVIVIKN